MEETSPNQAHYPVGGSSARMGGPPTMTAGMVRSKQQSSMMATAASSGRGLGGAAHNHHPNRRGYRPAVGCPLLSTRGCRRATLFASRRALLRAARVASELDAPLTPTQRLLRAKDFWSATLPIILSYIFLDNWLKVRGLDKVEEDMLWEGVHEWGSKRLSSIVNDLKGFYVKSGQLIATRVDLFPRAYTDKLRELQDRLDPLPADVVKSVVSRELLGGQPLDTVFSSFDDAPLGSASIAQVHRATLRNGKVVAVKVMRPHIEPKLRGDVQNIIKMAKIFKDYLPLDYYLVFSEIAERMEDELDFQVEARSMDRIQEILQTNPDGSARLKPALHVPRSVPGLVAQRVLVMDYMDGVTLAQLNEDSDGSEKKTDAISNMLGRRLVTSLTKGFGQMVFQAGLLHGDPHPGNIMLLKTGEVALIDFGQTKRLSRAIQEQMAEICLLLGEEVKNHKEISRVVGEMGVKLVKGADELALSACAIWMFDSASEMPGQFTPDELSDTSPVRCIASFPQDLVMVGRAAVLVRGICAYFSVPWSVSGEWSPLAKFKLFGTPLEREMLWQQKAKEWLKRVNFALVVVFGQAVKALKSLFRFFDNVRGEDNSGRSLAVEA